MINHNNLQALIREATLNLKLRNQPNFYLKVLISEEYHIIHIQYQSIDDHYNERNAY